MSEHVKGTEALGKNIRLFRTNAGIKQKDLAIAVNITPGYLCDIEHGRKIPSTSLIQEIANVLGLPMELLLSINGSGSLFSHGSKRDLKDPQLEQQSVVDLLSSLLLSYQSALSTEIVRRKLLENGNTTSNNGKDAVSHK